MREWNYRPLRRLASRTTARRPRRLFERHRRLESRTWSSSPWSVPTASRSSASVVSRSSTSASKLAAERVVAGSGLPWTTLRATQFYDLILMTARGLTKLPVVPVPAVFRFQPVDADDVAARLVELALGSRRAGAGLRRTSRLPHGRPDQELCACRPSAPPARARLGGWQDCSHDPRRRQPGSRAARRRPSDARPGRTFSASGWGEPSADGDGRLYDAASAPAISEPVRQR